MFGGYIKGILVVQVRFSVAPKTDLRGRFGGTVVCLVCDILVETCIKIDYFSACGVWVVHLSTLKIPSVDLTSAEWSLFSGLKDLLKNHQTCMLNTAFKSPVSVVS